MLGAKSAGATRVRAAQRHSMSRRCYEEAMLLEIEQIGKGGEGRESEWVANGVILS